MDSMMVSCLESGAMPNLVRALVQRRGLNAGVHQMKARLSLNGATTMLVQVFPDDKI
jgi:hypothetical protein